MLEKWIEAHEAQIRELRYTLHLIRKSPLTIVGIIIVAGFVILSTISPWIVPYPEDAIGFAVHTGNKLQPPSWDHLFGTDDLGRDIFSRVLVGGRISLWVGMIVVAIAMGFGTFLGLISGYWGGKTDEFIMRMTDVFLSVPVLVLAILVAVVMGKSLENVVIALSLTRWTRTVRLVRGLVLSIKEQPYIEAARMVGASKKRILFRHILPNIMSPLTVSASLNIGAVILLAAALGFLGLGATSPTPDWGLMVSIGRMYLPSWWWIATFPGLAIFITALGFNLFGDGIRDIMDPKLRKGR